MICNAIWDYYIVGTLLTKTSVEVNRPYSQTILFSRANTHTHTRACEEATRERQKNHYHELNGKLHLCSCWRVRTTLYRHWFNMRDYFCISYHSVTSESHCISRRRYDSASENIASVRFCEYIQLALSFLLFSHIIILLHYKRSIMPVWFEIVLSRFCVFAWAISTEYDNLHYISWIGEQ